MLAVIHFQIVLSSVPPFLLLSQSQWSRKHACFCISRSRRSFPQARPFPLGANPRSTGSTLASFPRVTIQGFSLVPPLLYLNLSERRLALPLAPSSSPGPASVPCGQCGRACGRHGFPGSVNLTLLIVVPRSLRLLATCGARAPRRMGKAGLARVSGGQEETTSLRT